MALMDMATISPLLRSLSHLLKPGGSFVFSVIHPCFQPPGMTKVAEEDDREGQIATRYAVKVSSYITPAAFKGLGVIGQPLPQYYFHRPLSLLFKECFQAGFILDGLEEPVFDLETDVRRALSWANFKEIPPALVVRMRLYKR
jgi:SAM-dependent methyltransferase